MCPCNTTSLYITYAHTLWRIFVTVLPTLFALYRTPARVLLLHLLLYLLPPGIEQPFSAAPLRCNNYMHVYIDIRTICISVLAGNVMNDRYSQAVWASSLPKNAQCETEPEVLHLSHNESAGMNVTKCGEVVKLQ